MEINPDKCGVAQGFGANANPSYAGAGLKGHTGIDSSCGFGAPIHAPFNMLVYKVLTVDSPARDGSGFTGVFGIVDDGLEMFEFMIGHCNPSVQIGDQVKKGDVIGTEANHGTVYSGGQQITLAMQKAGDQRGHHRHNQKRPVMKVQHTQPGQFYLDCYSDSPAGTLFCTANNYYQIWNYLNGYNGCIDPSISVFQRNLQFGMSGYDVYVLQNVLAKEGLATYAPTGYFGNLTKNSMVALQDKLGIQPDAGLFGPITRAAVINKYHL